MNDFERYKNENCKKCKNKDENLCKIVLNIDGQAQCIFKKETSIQEDLEK